MSKYKFGIMHLPIKTYLKWWLDKYAEVKEKIFVGKSETNPAYLTNCLKRPLLKFILIGKTEQESTTGKQLFDKNSSYRTLGTNVTILDTGVRLTQTDDGTYRMATFKGIDLRGLENKTLRVSYTARASGTNRVASRIYLLTSDGYYNHGVQLSNTIYSTNPTTTLTIPDDISEHPYLGIQLYVNYDGTGVVGNTIDFTDLIVTIDNADMSYEPYTRSEYQVHLQPIHKR